LSRILRVVDFFLTNEQAYYLMFGIFLSGRHIHIGVTREVNAVNLASDGGAAAGEPVP
jgi:hypothetical protein